MSEPIIVAFINIELGINPEDDRGAAWWGNWVGKPTIQEVIQVFADKFQNGSPDPRKAYDHGFWYMENYQWMNQQRFNQVVENYADSKIHKSEIWRIPICQMV